MTENDLPIEPSADGSITPPSPELQLAPTVNDGAATQPPDVVLPERSLVHKPRWPHPSFGWSLLWCLLFWIVTQLPGAFIVVLFVVGMFILSPDTMKQVKEPDDLYNLDAMNIAFAIAFFITEVLVVGFSWVIIRLVVGRDWMRQLAVRRPSLVHTLLALASVPVLALMGDISYELLRDSGLVPSISHANPLNLIYFWTAVFVVLGVAVLIARLFAGSGWTRRLAGRPTRPADILGAAAVLPVLVLCIFGAYVALSKGFLFPTPDLKDMKLSGMEEMGKIFTNWPLGFAVLVIGVGPGIGEELWCRGFLGRGLVGNHGAVLGVLATSFLFGLIHGDPCQGTMAMIMGLWLHFVYLTTRSLWLPMLLHFLNNSLSVVLTRLPSVQLMEAKPQNIPLEVYVSALLLLGGVAYALYQSRVRLAAKSPEQEFTWRPAFEGVEYPPANSGTQVVHPSPSLAASALAGIGFLLFVLAFAAWLRQGLSYGG
ncbi:MAG TPA: type II CAAX endopeptidase family protein [Gemmataceae bacterium]